MKYIYFIFALLTITTSCELRTTSFDPDNQFVSEDELAQISVWNHYQAEQVGTEEYERWNYRNFIKTGIDYRQNSSGDWVIEGSIQSFANKVHYKNAELVILYFGEKNTFIGSEKHILAEELAPGDQSGFYLKSDKFRDAHSLKVKINRIAAVTKQ